MNNNNNKTISSGTTEICCHEVEWKMDGIDREITDKDINEIFSKISIGATEGVFISMQGTEDGDKEDVQCKWKIKGPADCLKRPVFVLLAPQDDDGDDLITNFLEDEISLPRQCELDEAGAKIWKYSFTESEEAAYQRGLMDGHEWGDYHILSDLEQILNDWWEQLDEENKEIITGLKEEQFENSEDVFGIECDSIWNGKSLSQKLEIYSTLGDN